MSALPEGTILKGEKFQYKIVKKLGQGGFGITYLASVKIAGALGAIDTNMKVAIKEFFMRDFNSRGSDGITVTSGNTDGYFTGYMKKFIQETESLSKLQHKHIINVVEAFHANNTVYFSMEFIDGGSLEDYIMEKGRLDTNETIRIAKQIGEALSFMHDRQMLHLDIKPGNVMMREKRDAVLIDFGLSKQYDETGKPETSTTVGGGTPGYAPIEQIQFKKGNAKDFPVTMDVYALGGTLYKMLTGMTPPYASDILNDGFPLYDLQVCGVSDGLAVSIAKAMMPTKKDRFQSVAAFMEEVCKWETKPTKQEARKKSEPNPQNQGYKPLKKKSEQKKQIQKIIFQEKKNKPKPSNKENEASLTSSQMNELGNDHFYGRKGKEIDYEEAIKWYRKAAEKGNAVAQNNLGNMYKNALGVKKNDKEAAKWFQLSAEQGNASGQYNLGLMYQHGHGVEQDYTKAFAWYEKSAKKGNAYGQYLLAQMYESGYGTKMNLSHARYWYEKASAQGDEEAKKRLKELKLGSKKSEPKPSNNVEGTGMTPSQMYELGKDYYMGRNGKSKNLAEAFKWFGTAAKKGDVQAMVSLASMLELGDGVEKDLVQAQAWYVNAAAKGSEFAKNKLEGQKEKDDDDPGCILVIGLCLQVIYPLLWWVWTWFSPEYHYPAIGTLALSWVCGGVLFLLCIGMKNKFLQSCITWGFLILETIGIYMLNYN